jgi:hypothetical protein
MLRKRIIFLSSSIYLSYFAYAGVYVPVSIVIPKALIAS